MISRRETRRQATSGELLLARMVEKGMRQHAGGMTCEVETGARVGKGIPTVERSLHATSELGGCRTGGCSS